MRTQIKFPKILALHAGGIGDLILALPALRAFRKAFSESSLDLMGYRERLSLIAYDLQAQTVHSIDQSGMAYFYSEGELLPSRLVDLFSSFSTALIIGQSGARTLAENIRRSEIRQVILLASFPPEGEKKHVSNHLLEALRSFGIEGPDLFHPLNLPGESVSFAKEFLSKTGWAEGKPILAIHPGSGSPSKNWSPGNFALVADWASEHANLFLISGPARDGRDEFLRAMKSANPILLDHLPLLDLASILAKCRAYLGNDSGITHLAAMMGIPTLALFGPTDPAIWGPRGAKVQIISAEEAGTLHPGERKEVLLSRMGQIKPEMVMERLAPILE